MLRVAEDSWFWEHDAEMDASINDPDTPDCWVGSLPALFKDFGDGGGYDAPNIRLEYYLRA